MVTTSTLMENLRQEGVSPDLLLAVNEYRTTHPLTEALTPRVPQSAFTYYGKDVWEQALAALLCGENLLLAGGKATGKKCAGGESGHRLWPPGMGYLVPREYGRGLLIGMDTFEGGAVKFRPGPVYRCAQCGGFGVLDEINMAKNEALAVLHAVLDFRRAIDVPGYERIPLAEETRFIATMNYGYAGTRELNEALTSRFVVIQMPTITEENLEKLLRAQFPDLTGKYVHQFAQLFLDLQKKCDSAEISTKALDLRGMLDALRLMRRGVRCRGCAGHGHHQQSLRLLRTGPHPGRHCRPHPGPAHRRKALQLRGLPFMEAQSYTAEERRAANQVWAAAGAYGFEPLFLARNTDGTVDFYMNCIVGLVHKYYGDDLVRGLFHTWDGDVKQSLLDDLTWLYLESAAYALELPRRPRCWPSSAAPTRTIFRHPVQALAAGVDGEEPAGLLHAGHPLAAGTGSGRPPVLTPYESQLAAAGPQSRHRPQARRN